MGDARLPVVWDVQKDEDGQVPETGALKLGGVAGVDQALATDAQVAVVQRLQDTPQVPAEAVIQASPGDGERVEQRLQAVVSAGGNRSETLMPIIIKLKKVLIIKPD